MNVSREDKIANVMIRDRVQRQTTVIDIIKREGNYRCLNTLAGPTTTHFSADHAGNDKRYTITRKTCKKVERRH